MVDLGLGVPKCATVTHFAAPEGCCWRWLIWAWVFQVLRVLVRSVFFQIKQQPAAFHGPLTRLLHGGARSGFECCKACNCHACCVPRGGAVGNFRSGFECSKACICHACCSPSGMLLEVFDVALNVPKCGGGARSGFLCSNVRNSRTFHVPRGVLLEVFDLDLFVRCGFKVFVFSCGVLPVEYVF